MRATGSTDLQLPRSATGFALASLSAALLAMTIWASAAHAATFAVTNTNDSGAGSLRQAIENANSNSNPGVRDAITFAIPAATDPGCVAGGVCTISPESRLPDITEPVFLNGYSQPGASANTLAVGSDAVLKVELDGTDAGIGDGLKIAAPNSVVRGLVINRWSGSGVEMAGAGVSSNRVEGNFIGTDASGTQPLGNGGNGVYIENAPNNAVGGTSPAARNTISANDFKGVWIIGNVANGSRISGNFIGTDASGTRPLGNRSEGVNIQNAPNSAVGGTSPAARNTISANDLGVVVSGLTANGSRISGNFIGTDASGQEDLGNADGGVTVDDTPDVVVGGTTPTARNVISGNGGSGVIIQDSGSSGNSIQGNYVGTDASGQGDLGNDDDGVDISRATDNVVGGTLVGAANTIAFNGGDGVSIDEGDTTGNSVLRNSIFVNGELGIDLGDDGVTPNDAQDPDPGPNLLQNFPTVSSATTPDGRSITVRGTLNSNPTDAFNVQLFASPEADPSGFGEGRRYLGQTNVVTNAGGNAAFSFSSANASVPAGYVVTATATNAVTNDTSEFSEAFEVEDDTAPRVIATNPLDRTTGVLPGTNVSATFSEQMRASTVNTNTFRLFRKVGPDLVQVPATVSYSPGTRRGVLNPNANLEPGSQYVARVYLGARDLANNPLAEVRTFTFFVRE